MGGREGEREKGRRAAASLCACVVRAGGLPSPLATPTRRILGVRGVWAQEWGHPGAGGRVAGKGAHTAPEPTRRLAPGNTRAPAPHTRPHLRSRPPDGGARAAGQQLEAAAGGWDRPRRGRKGQPKMLATDAPAQRPGARPVLSSCLLATDLTYPRHRPERQRRAGEGEHGGWQREDARSEKSRLRCFVWARPSLFRLAPLLPAL